MDVRAAPASFLAAPPLDRSASTSPLPKAGTLTPQHQHFRRSIEANDEMRLRKLLGALTPAERYHMVNSPLPEGAALGEPLPRLPLSRAAAQGDVGNVLALMHLGPAVGMLADEYTGGLQLTAAYWAAAYGQRPVLEALDSEGCAPLSQVVLACHQGTYVGILEWSCLHGATPAHFREAMEMAIEASPERLDDIDNLVRTAHAKLDVPCTELAQQSILYMAIERGHLQSARRLLLLGAQPDYSSSQAQPGASAQFEDADAATHVVELTLQRGHLDLLVDLFRAGAAPDSSYLKYALSQAPNPAGAYIALFHCGVVPQSDTEAAGLERTCINNGQAGLAGLISTQRIGLQLVARTADAKDVEMQKATAQARTQAHARALGDGLGLESAFAEGVSLFVADASMGAFPKVAVKKFKMAFNGKRPPFWDKVRLKIAPDKTPPPETDGASQALTVQKRGRNKRA